MYDPGQLEAGDVILVRGGAPWDPIASIIRLATVSPYHHAALVGEGHLVEAGLTVVRSPLDEYVRTGDSFPVRCAKPQAERGVAAAEARIDAPYGIAELLTDGGRYFLHMPLVYPWNARRLTCSGLIAYAYREAGVPLTYEPCPSPASLSCSPLLKGTRPWEHP